MTEKSMVEKVKAAIEAEIGSLGGCGDNCRCGGAAEQIECMTGTTIEEVARAAIEAMFTPTLAMMGAAETEHAHWNVDDADERLENSEAWVRNTYRAAITEALKG